MTNVIFCLTLAVLSLHFFGTSYSLIGINRTLFNIPISIFETSIPILQEKEEVEMYYDKDLLESKLTSYFEKELPKYCEKYDVFYFYYDQDTMAYNFFNPADAVEINLYAKVSLAITYNKTARFYIQDNR